MFRTKNTLAFAFFPGTSLLINFATTHSKLLCYMNGQALNSRFSHHIFSIMSNIGSKLLRWVLLTYVNEEVNKSYTLSSAL